MRILSWEGVRGGVGASSLLAGVATALARSGERVLCLDMDPRNLLRMHLGVAWRDGRGWASAEGSAWHHAAFACETRLHLLPYGHLMPVGQHAMEKRLRAAPDWWQQQLGRLVTGRYDWLLIDTPQEWPGHAGQFASLVHQRLVVAHADPSCHLLLDQCGLPPDCTLIVNQFVPRSKLQQDLLLLWQSRWPQQLVPCPVHRDEAIPEGLAHKQSVLHYHPESQAALDMDRLALWCMARRQEAA